MTLLSEWISAVTHDCDDSTLYMFADWLEEQGDHACEGIREYVIPRRHRPMESGQYSGSCYWALWEDNLALPCNIPMYLDNRLQNHTKSQSHLRYYTTAATAIYDLGLAYFLQKNVCKQCGGKGWVLAVDYENAGLGISFGSNRVEPPQTIMARSLYLPTSRQVSHHCFIRNS